jgi:hypothetical protein
MSASHSVGTVTVVKKFTCATVAYVVFATARLGGRLSAISRRSFFIYEETCNIVQLSDSIDITLPLSGAVFGNCHAIQRSDFKSLLVEIFLQIQRAHLGKR